MMWPAAGCSTPVVRRRYVANCTQHSQTWLGVAAWMSFDGLAHNDSRRLFRVAVGCLGEYDWHLRTMLLCDMARQEIWCGDPDTGPDVRGDGPGAGGSPHSHRAGDGQYRPGPPPAAPMEVSAELLGQSDDDALRATQEAEPVDVLVLRDLADEFGTVAAQAGNDVVDVVDSEHDAAYAQRVRRRAFRLGSDRRRRVELRQLNPAVAVRGPHQGDVGTDAAQPDDAVHPTPLDRCLAFQLHTEFSEERFGSLEVVDNDENVVHPLNRHRSLHYSLRATHQPKCR